MGSGMSAEERREHIRTKLESCLNDIKNCPDVTVNRAIVRFCGASSSDSLQQHLNERKQTNYPIEDWMKQLAEKLTNFSQNPKLAGLGALAFAIFIDIISNTSPERTEDALRRVFAEEKASEVWDQIDECLRRYVMHIDDNDELTRDIRRLESQLSIALTKLKNSMVRDGHMSSEALRAWVNGAAFHIQMLIHLVRLGGIQTCNPIERLLSTYLSDLDPLFEKHEAAVKKKCTAQIISAPFWNFETETGEQGLVPVFSVIPFITFDEYFDAYYEKKYSSQKYEIREYFRKVGDDLPGLISQVGHLSIH
ncbi:uncharacterized protein ABDE67_013422 [Symphorus nematophorus]